MRAASHTRHTPTDNTTLLPDQLLSPPRPDTTLLPPLQGNNPPTPLPEQHTRAKNMQQEPDGCLLLATSLGMGVDAQDCSAPHGSSSSRTSTAGHPGNHCKYTRDHDASKLYRTAWHACYCHRQVMEDTAATACTRRRRAGRQHFHAPSPAYAKHHHHHDSSTSTAACTAAAPTTMTTTSQPLHSHPNSGC